MINLSDISSGPEQMPEPSDSTPVTWDAWIRLPEAAGRVLNSWTKRTEGASWSPMGGHITLLSEATGLVPFDGANRAVANDCNAQVSFSVTLSTPRVDDYWPDPDQRIVMLICDEASESSMRALRQALTTTLNVDPTSLWPERSGHDFTPHLSLAVGISPVEAAHVCEQARSLVIEFPVTELTVGYGRTVVTHKFKATS